MTGLTDRQAEVWTFIRAYTVEHGYPPTVQELADHLLLSRANALDHVERLVRKGYVRRDFGVARSLVAVDPSEVRPLAATASPAPCPPAVPPRSRDYLAEVHAALDRLLAGTRSGDEQGGASVARRERA